MTPLRLVAALLFAALAAPAAAAPFRAVCALERPMIGYAEHVVVTALTDAPAGTPLQVTWSADGGALSQGSSPSSAVWAPTSQARAVFTIEAHVVASGETADCTTRIAVTDRLTRGSNEILVSTRSLLAPDVQEAAGYGLYSYILFTAAPTDQDRDLFESILKSYLTLLRDQDTLETRFPDTFPRSRLNVTYVPIAQPLPDDFDQRDDQVAWIRNHYDYDRAFAFLTRLRTLPGADAAMLGGTVWDRPHRHRRARRRVSDRHGGLQGPRRLGRGGMRRAGRIVLTGLALQLATPALAQPTPRADAPAQAAAEAQVSIQAGMFDLRRGAPADALARFEHALALARQAADSKGEAAALLLAGLASEGLRTQEGNA